MPESFCINFIVEKLINLSHMSKIFKKTIDVAKSYC
jgi:hypothetical protein